MYKRQTRNLLIAILPCLGWALAQPTMAADIKTTSTYSKAFADARKAGHKTFKWNGKIYSTVKAKALTTHKANVKTAEAVATTAPAMAPVPLVATTTHVAAPTPTPVAAAIPNSVSSVPPFVFAPVTITPLAPAFIARTPMPWSPRPNPYIVQPVTVTVAPAQAQATATQAALATPAPAPAALATFSQQSQPEPAQIASKVVESPMVSSSGNKPKNFDAQDSKKSRSLLPTITKVYPTGEKPMVVITFNCPTELVGLDTPSTKILHTVFDLGFGAINATDLLPWTLQQVCS